MNLFTDFPTASDQLRKDKRYNNFQNWLQDTQLDTFDFNESETLEQVLENNQTETIIKNRKQLETVSYSTLDKNGPIYNMFYNTITDPNDMTEINQNDGHKNWILPFTSSDGYNKFYIKSYGSIATNMYLVVPGTCNLNELMTAEIELSIDNVSVAFTSLCFLLYIGTLFDQKIIKKLDKDNRESYFIPIPITRLFMDGKINFELTCCSEKYVNIYCPNNIKLSYIEVKYVFINRETITAHEHNYQKAVTFHNKLKIPKNANPLQFHVDNIRCPIFICCWMIMDQSDFSEMQSIAPSILSVKLDIKYQQQTYEKVIDKTKIKKVNVRNYNGYIIPLNNLSCNNIKTLINTPRKSMDRLWENPNASIDMVIEWDNYQFAEIFIDIIVLDIGIIQDGHFCYMW